MLLQFIANGLITGILYSLLAMGFALVYNTTCIFHFAAVDLYVSAVYMFWSFVAKAGLSVIVAAIFANILTMLLSLLSVFFHHLWESPFGRVLNAIRADETMVKSMGCNTVLFKYTFLC